LTVPARAKIESFYDDNVIEATYVAIIAPAA